MLKKQAYLLVIFGVSLLLCAQRAYYFIYGIVDKILTMLPLPQIVNNFFNLIVEIVIFGVIFFFVYLNLPEKYKNLQWLKSSIFFLLVAFIILDLINTGMSIYRYSSFGGIDEIMHIVSRVVRGFVFELILFVFLLVLTMRVFSMKEVSSGPPPIRR